MFIFACDVCPDCNFADCKFVKGDSYSFADELDVEIEFKVGVNVDDEVNVVDTEVGIPVDGVNSSTRLAFELARVRIDEGTMSPGEKSSSFGVENVNGRVAGGRLPGRFVSLC
jgi:hypothetical protein